MAPNAPTGSQNLTVRAAYGNQVTERDLTLTVSASGGVATVTAKEMAT